MIIGLDNYSYSERLKVLNINTLYYRRKTQDRIIRIISGILCIDFNFFFQYDYRNVGITRS